MIKAIPVIMQQVFDGLCLGMRLQHNKREDKPLNAKVYKTKCRRESEKSLRQWHTV